MMPDLRARLKAVSNKPKAEQPALSCRVEESTMPLSSMPGIKSIETRHIRWLGLEMPEWSLEKTLFLDTETTGLRGAGTIAFLVGLGWVEKDQFIVRQLLMRDYPEEAPLLECVSEFLSRFDCVVSFNGKSFDLPLLRDRFTMARLRDRWRELPQLDLLHAARRTWRSRLGKCTLGTLEEAVLGIRREDDLPGAQVPERYFQFLKTGDTHLLDDVLAHNAQDIRSLAILLSRLALAYETPEAQTSMLDVLSIGRALDRVGEGGRARRCYQVASVSDLSKQARLHLAQSYRREKDYVQAAEAYRGLIARGEADAGVYTTLAILLEWRLRDLPSALEVTEAAIRRFAGHTWLHQTTPETLDALERRRVRLSKKICACKGGQSHWA